MARGNRIWIGGAALFGVLGLVGCQGGHAQKAGEDEAAIESAPSVTADAPAPFVERDLWLAIAEEPGWQLNQARDEFLSGENREAADDLAKVAALMNFELRHARTPEARRQLMAAVEELREVARQVRFQEVPFEGVADVRELDRVAANAFRALGLHHTGLARESLENGDALMAGRYLLESADDAEWGFVRAGEASDPVMTKELADARVLAKELIVGGEGERGEALAALGEVEDAVHGLGEVLGSRRR